jgi:hypothetical protein
MAVTVAPHFQKVRILAEIDFGGARPSWDEFFSGG